MINISFENIQLRMNSLNALFCYSSTLQAHILKNNYFRENKYKIANIVILIKIRVLHVTTNNLVLNITELNE